jgi:sec-independent protein translocase protein TatC
VLDEAGRAPALDHLEELRWRIIAAAAWFAVAFGVAWWQMDHIFHVLNRPLAGHGFKVITLGVTEPFFTSLTVSANAAFVATFPVLAWHVWRFIAPAMDRDQRRSVRRLALAAPVLFGGGVAFCYFVVLQAAIRFLLGIGAGNFDVSVRASDYYSFVSMTMLAMGLVFLFPLVLLGLARLGVVNSAWLRANRKVALLLIAVAAALLPTGDPVSLAAEILPMFALFELSILLVRLQERRA